MIIYAIDKTDNTKEATRKVTIDFFKQVLGFEDENIILVDRSEFGDSRNIGEGKGHVYTKFSEETENKMKEFARHLFGDKEYLIANQVLNIAICEC